MNTVHTKQGGALVIVMVVMVAVTILAAGLMKLVERDTVETAYAGQSEQAFWLAEAGAQAALHLLRTNSLYRSSPYDLPHVFDTGSNLVTVMRPDPAEEVWEILSRGFVGNEERAVSFIAELTVFPGTTNMIPPGIIGFGQGPNRLDGSGSISGNIFCMGELTSNGSTDPDISGDVYAYESNIPHIEIEENNIVDFSIDPLVIADFSLEGPRPAYTTIDGREYLQLDGGITVVTEDDLQPNGTFELGEGIRGSGTLIVPDLSGSGTDLIFSSAGEPYIVEDNIRVWVDGEIHAQKDGVIGSNVTFYSTQDMTLKKSVTGESVAFYTLEDFQADMDLELSGLIYAEGDVQIDGSLTLEGSIIAGNSFWLKDDFEIISVESSLLSAALNLGVTPNVYAVNPGGWSEVHP